MVKDPTERSTCKLLFKVEELTITILFCFPNQENNPIFENELKALIADITSKRLKSYMLSNLFKALEVEHWGEEHDDYITVLRHWSLGMGGDATCRSHLAYHLKRIGLPLLGQK